MKWALERQALQREADMKRLEAEGLAQQLAALEDRAREAARRHGELMEEHAALRLRMATLQVWCQGSRGWH